MSGRINTKEFIFKSFIWYAIINVTEGSDFELRIVYSLKKKGGKRGKGALGLGWNRPTGKPLSCPQKWTACIMTSRCSHFARGLSNKKAQVYYCSFVHYSDHSCILASFIQIPSVPIYSIATVIKFPDLPMTKHPFKICLQKWSWQKMWIDCRDII